MQPNPPAEPSEPRFEPGPSVGRVAFFAFGSVLLAGALFLVVVLVMLHN